MAIYTRFGAEVEIRYRCDDYETADDPCVHFAYIERPNDDLRTVPIWELRADGGAVEITEAAEAAPFAHCTGKHERTIKTGLQRAWNESLRTGRACRECGERDGMHTHVCDSSRRGMPMYIQGPSRGR